MVTWVFEINGFSAVRLEGWATWLEEVVINAGLFEGLPRIRELVTQ